MQGNVDNARDAFDAFLERYPYCYGYWKKYGDLEKKQSDNQMKVQQVGASDNVLLLKLYKYNCTKD